ncbi:bifunctional serine/threonine-protein kinase/formylglycine-generating enzyme family protein [Marilutibacter spongiae]|uniref:Protein kinase n=1 Tax=Marilutibacter spongiae TaxID=2025720 RepID=A0A7W3Y615_9GAMM|nr:bifunctional serine/threonine-protein kinase/formylglycine-generating enzyme family protein [Lysobacter spongiae]MBB1061003.1 protein kinase [Lysobacter spongiae]
MSSHVASTEIGSVPFPEIQGYRLLRVLNHGSASTVYLGEQESLAREVAIKVMLPQALSDEVSRRRFENEVRTIARLEHPHVVTIHEVGRTKGGLPYYAMPYMPRGHLGQRSFRKQVAVGDERRVLEIVRALLSALEYAHGHGVVHRDVKAENVLFDDSDRPLLADFGIALRRGYGPRVTATGMAVGSTAYMAPEQARGEDVDGRADLYSLAVLLWELLTGALPYQASDALSMAVMHAKDPIPKLPMRLRHWQRFMNRALAKAPSARFQDVAQMRDAIERVQTRSAVPGAAVLHGIGEAFRRHRVALAAGAAALVVVVALAGLLRDGGDGFFVAEKPVEAAPPPPDPTESMLRPLPEAPIQVALESARRQLDARNLTAPEGDNAHATLLAAWRLEPDNTNVHGLLGELDGALSAELLDHLQAGRFERARDYQQRLAELESETGALDVAAARKRQQRVAGALDRHVTEAVERNDRPTARRVAALAPDFDLPRSESARLLALAEAPVEDSAGETVADAGGGHRIEHQPVTVADYTRFAEATGRKPALCRERASLLRVLDPRNFKDPGFSQDPGAPVVCVSMADAEAYARWLGRRDGHQYRLPTVQESATRAASVPGGRALSLWQRDCGKDCNQRQVRGASWRSDRGERLLQSDRGYDDVGFRLTRAD